MHASAVVLLTCGMLLTFAVVGAALSRRPWLFALLLLVLLAFVATLVLPRARDLNHTRRSLPRKLPDGGAVLRRYTVPGIVVDDRLFQTNRQILAAWLAYGSARYGTRQESLISRQPAQHSDPHEFVVEAQARELMARLWEDFKREDSSLADPYLDDLSRVRQAGFVGEYVWHFLRSCEWGKTPDHLRLPEFENWRETTLPNHEVKTFVDAQSPETRQRQEGGDGRVRGTNG